MVVVPFTSNADVNADALFENNTELFVTNANVADIFPVFAVTRLSTVILPVPDDPPIVNVDAVMFCNSALLILIFPDVSPTPIVPPSDTNSVVVLLPLLNVPANMMSFDVI